MVFVVFTKLFIYLTTFLVNQQPSIFGAFNFFQLKTHIYISNDIILAKIFQKRFYSSYIQHANIYLNVTIQILTLNPNVLLWLYSMFGGLIIMSLKMQSQQLIMYEIRYDRNDIDVGIWQFLGPKPEANTEHQNFAIY